MLAWLSETQLGLCPVLWSVTLQKVHGNSTEIMSQGYLRDIR